MLNPFLLYDDMDMLSESQYDSMIDLVNMLFDKWVMSNDIDSTNEEIREMAVSNKNNILNILRCGKAALDKEDKNQE